MKSFEIEQMWINKGIEQGISQGITQELQANTKTLVQICTGTLIRNLRLWRVQELVSR